MYTAYHGTASNLVLSSTTISYPSCLTKSIDNPPELTITSHRHCDEYFKRSITGKSSQVTIQYDLKPILHIHPTASHAFY
ncbi:Protein of unknown function [Pyronema omphalodes CBS 100304]|uniref:Uncharacterized protein n=1 Tax=Pyronema omphalodes (strain CBS 100304) TaxID=1076935 RepID=U4LC44_PYROM|nr:Protein of unknown function [Pyronema omphalodes CBS 100304]